MNSLSRRDFLRFTAGVAGMSLLAACAAPAAPQSAVQGETAPTEITFWW